MSEEEVKNDNNNSKKKWLLLLLLLFLIILVIWGIVVFLKDDGTAQALDDEIVSNEIVKSEDKSEDDKEVEDKKDSKDTTKPVATIKTATQETVATTAGVSSSAGAASSATVQKELVKVNIEDDSYFSEPVVIEIAGNEYTATITDSKGNVVTYNGKTTITEEGTYTLTIKETDGKETSVSFIVDTTAPVIEGVEEKLYNTEVSPKVTEINLEGITLTKDGTKVNYSLGNSIEEDGEYTLEVIDKAGNKASVSFEIDRTAPVCNVNYSIITPTKQDVTVTITASEPIFGYTGWDKAGNDNTITKVFTENAEENLVLKDEAGNETSVTVKVNNIDRVDPILTVKPESKGTDPYYSEIHFKLNDDYSIDKYVINGTEVDVENSQYGDANYDILNPLLIEGENTIVLYDVAGNKTEYNFIIDWTEPVLTVKPESKVRNLLYREIYFKLNDNILIDKYEVNGKEVDVSNSQWGDANYDVLSSLVKEGENTITLYDVAGNKTEYKFIMDRTAPTCTVTYTPDGLTNGDVKVTITASEALLRHPGWDKEESYIITKTFTENGEENVLIVDRAGNDTTVNVKVTNIDRVSPEIKIQNSVGRDSRYSKLDFVFSDDRLLDKYVINGKEVDFSDDRYSNANYINIKPYLVEGENTIKLYDKAGNETIKTFTMDWTAPTAKNITYSTKELTNGNVVVVIEATEALYGHPGWSVAGRAYKIKKTFTTNTTEVVVLEDKAGNKTPVTIEITNIDRVPGVISVQSCKGTDPYFSEVTFAFSDDRLADKYVINGKEIDFGDNKYSNANYGNMKPYLVEGENTIKLYDKAGNETVKTFIMDWTPAVINIESFMNLNTGDMGEKLTSNEDIVIVNEPGLVSENGSLREYKVTYNLYYPTFVSYHHTLIVVRDRAGNETTMVDTDGDGGMFIPEYTTSTLSSTPMRMVKSARPVTSAAPTTPVVEEPKVEETPEVTDTPVVEEPKVEETPVVTDTPVVEEPKVEEIPVVTDTPVVEEPKVEETPEVTDTPVVEEPKIEETPVVTEPPVVEEPKVEETPEVTDTPVVEEPKVEETPVVTETPVVEEPKVEETPVVTETPVVEETPVVTETPVVEEIPEVA